MLLIEIRPAAGRPEANKTASADPVRVAGVAPTLGLNRNLLVKSYFSSAF